MLISMWNTENTTSCTSPTVSTAHTLDPNCLATSLSLLLDTEFLDDRCQDWLTVESPKPGHRARHYSTKLYMYFNFSFYNWTKLKPRMKPLSANSTPTYWNTMTNLEMLEMACWKAKSLTVERYIQGTLKGIHPPLSAPKLTELTSKMNRMFYIHPFGFGQGHQHPFLPLHQLHCNGITNNILMRFCGNNTVTWTFICSRARS